MQSWTFALALLLRPLALFLILGCVLLPIRYAVIWWFPEGRIKRFLLLRVDAGADTHANRGETRLKNMGQ